MSKPGTIDELDERRLRYKGAIEALDHLESTFDDVLTTDLERKMWHTLQESLKSYENKLQELGS